MMNSILTREELEKREYELLASYAMKSAETGGRNYTEEEHPYRSVFQRDKDRIIYSTAFRRLEYKTQVFVNHEGDYYRTRLTHTLEVAQISRTIARALRLNEELVEAIALAHDLGHTPFGHSGEDTLAKLMKHHGGFDHNTHGLRVVDVLEERYPDFPGLNLSLETRCGIIRHSTPFDLKRAQKTDIKCPRFLEIGVVDVSDEIAYDNHDLDDGLKSGLLDAGDLAGVDIWEEAGRTFHQLINLQVSDLIQATLRRIKDLKINSTEDLDAQKVRIVDFSESMNEKRAKLREVLTNKLYKHYRVVRMSSKASRFLKRLFEVYSDNPEQLSPHVRGKIGQRGKYKVICDYIAGMTDRYALDQYKKLFEPFERV
jgi:dGTPase